MFIDLSAIKPARILYYDFFANAFLYELLLQNQNLLEKQIEFLAQEPLCDLETYQILQTNIQQHFQEIIQEYTSLFTLPFANPIYPYLSHYQEGQIGGESLVYIKTLLKESGFFLDRSFTKENEDHFGILCLFMKFLLLEEDDQKAQIVFQSCIAPFGKSMPEEIFSHPQSKTYRTIANILREFISFEENINSALT